MPAEAVNGLWIGGALSSLELLTIASFLRHGSEFRLWAYDPITTPLPPGAQLMDANAILPRDRVFRYERGPHKGSYAGFSDIFRAKLLLERGGWYVDMDVTCLKPLAFDEEYVFRSNAPEPPVVGNVMRCPKGSPLMRWVYETTAAEVDAQNETWSKPIAILWDGIRRHGLQGFVRDDICNKDLWEEVSPRLFGPTSFPRSWYFFHWCNEWMRQRSLPKNAPLPFSRLRVLMQRHAVPVEFPNRIALGAQAQYYKGKLRALLRKT